MCTHLLNPRKYWVLERDRRPQLTQDVTLVNDVGDPRICKSSYERRCQEKKILPAPQEDAGVVTCIQPHLMPRLIFIHRGVVGLVALARRRFQRRCQPQLLVPTQRFHETVALDAVRLRSYAS